MGEALAWDQANAAKRGPGPVSEAEFSIEETGLSLTGATMTGAEGKAEFEELAKRDANEAFESLIKQGGDKKLFDEQSGSLTAAGKAEVERMLTLLMSKLNSHMTKVTGSDLDLLLAPCSLTALQKWTGWRMLGC